MSTVPRLLNLNNPAIDNGIKSYEEVTKAYVANYKGKYHREM